MRITWTRHSRASAKQLPDGVGGATGVAGVDGVVDMYGVAGVEGVGRES